MKRLFPRNTLSVIFLVPVAIAASQSDGSSTTKQQAGPLTEKQIVDTLSGNTVKSADQEAYAFVAPDGALRGLNLPSGGKTGEWRVSSNGVLCAKWNEAGGKENCDQLRYLGDKRYGWGGSALNVLKGIPKNL